MTSPNIISCVFTFGILLLTNVKADEYNDKLKSLLNTLSNQRTKYGLNFDHIDGGHREAKNGQIYSHTHTYHSVKVNKPVQVQDPKNVISNLEALNLLMGFKPIGKSNDDEEINYTKEGLRICKKKPRVYHCTPEKCMTEPPEVEMCETDDKKFKKRNTYYYKQKRFGRSGPGEKYIQSNEAAEFLHDLDQMLQDRQKKVALDCADNTLCRSAKGYEKNEDSADMTI